MAVTLIEVLERSRSLGFLGPGPVEDHIDHADGFLAALEGVHGLVVDLGAGGGVPGLVVALARPDLELVLVDAMAKRCRFLEAAVRDLGVEPRVQVAEGRAEELGRGALRGAVDAVLARSFGAPAVTAECGAPLLRRAGLLIVSEPPVPGTDRWPTEGLAALGLRAARSTGAPSSVQVLEQVGECPGRFPRRVGIPAKRPLF